MQNTAELGRCVSTVHLQRPPQPLPITTAKINPSHFISEYAAAKQSTKPINVKQTDLQETTKILSDGGLDARPLLTLRGRWKLIFML